MIKKQITLIIIVMFLLGSVGSVVGEDLGYLPGTGGQGHAGTECGKGAMPPPDCSGTDNTCGSNFCHKLNYLPELKSLESKCTENEGSCNTCVVTPPTCSNPNQLVTVTCGKEKFTTSKQGTCTTYPSKKTIAINECKAKVYRDFQDKFYKMVKTSQTRRDTFVKGLDFSNPIVTCNELNSCLSNNAGAGAFSDGSYTRFKECKSEITQDTINKLAENGHGKLSEGKFSEGLEKANSEVTSKDAIKKLEADIEKLKKKIDPPKPSKWAQNLDVIFKGITALVGAAGLAPQFMNAEAALITASTGVRTLEFQKTQFAYQKSQDALARQDQLKQAAEQARQAAEQERKAEEAAAKAAKEQKAAEEEAKKAAEEQSPDAAIKQYQAELAAEEAEKAEEEAQKAIEAAREAEEELRKAEEAEKLAKINDEADAQEEELAEDIDEQTEDPDEITEGVDTPQQVEAWQNILSAQAEAQSYIDEIKAIDGWNAVLQFCNNHYTFCVCDGNVCTMQDATKIYKSDDVLVASLHVLDGFKGDMYTLEGQNNGVEHLEDGSFIIDQGGSTKMSVVSMPGAYVRDFQQNFIWVGPGTTIYYGTGSEKNDVYITNSIIGHMDKGIVVFTTKDTGGDIFTNNNQITGAATYDQSKRLAVTFDHSNLDIEPNAIDITGNTIKTKGNFDYFISGTSSFFPILSRNVAKGSSGVVLRKGVKVMNNYQIEDNKHTYQIENHGEETLVKVNNKIIQSSGGIPRTLSTRQQILLNS